MSPTAESGRSALTTAHTTIIVPVYRAAQELRTCLDSVVTCTDLRRHALLLVVDGPQDAVVETVLAGAPAAAQLLRNPTRLGFVGSVNRGMQATAGDVLLLNSDTVVTPNWLEQMLAAAGSAANVGTVTPLSNNASLCSVPRPFIENLLPSGFDAASFAALVQRVSTRAYPRIPTAVGFCMWIRRALLAQIGLFDEVNFGLGYGEENDFCMRASAHGWIHLADDATFVQHAGHRSFGSTRASLQRRGAAALQRLHPDYRGHIAAFMRDDPLAPVRQRIVAALQQAGRDLTGPTSTRTSKPGSPAHVLHLLHGWPPFAVAGTELYAQWLVREQLAHRQVSVYARIDDPARAQYDAVELIDHGARVRLLTNHFLQRNPLSRNAIASRRIDLDFERMLREQRPQLVHIHHLAGHAFSLARVARRMGIPIVQQVQDWWGLCGRANLLDTGGQRCSGPALGKCADCCTLTRIAPAPLWNRVLHGLRRVSAQRALACADAYVMGSACIRDDYRRAGLFAPGTPLHVLAYGVDIPTDRGGRRAAALPLRFGFIGSALPHKGLQVATAAFADIDPALATLTVWGSAGIRFDEADKDTVFASMDVLLMPSVGLESFGLVAREAMARGVPVVATHDGALVELEHAELFAGGDVPALRAIITRLAADPAQVDAWSQRLGPVKSSAAHALEIEQVYADVLAARR